MPDYPQQSRVNRVIREIASKGHIGRRQFREIGRLLTKGYETGQPRVPYQEFAGFVPTPVLAAAFDRAKERLARRQDQR